MRRSPGPVIVDVSTLVVPRRSGKVSESAGALRLAWRDRSGRGAWSALDVGYILALFGIVMLNLLDITITLIHTSAHGWNVEGNPFIREVAQNAGIATVVLFKVVLVAVALGIMWYLFRRTRHAMDLARERGRFRQAVLMQTVVSSGTLLLLLFYMWVVMHNSRIVWG